MSAKPNHSTEANSPGKYHGLRWDTFKIYITFSVLLSEKVKLGRNCSHGLWSRNIFLCLATLFPCQYGRIQKESKSILQNTNVKWPRREVLSSYCFLKVLVDRLTFWDLKCYGPILIQKFWKMCLNPLKEINDSKMAPIEHSERYYLLAVQIT